MSVLPLLPYFWKRKGEYVYGMLVSKISFVFYSKIIPAFGAEKYTETNIQCLNNKKYSPEFRLNNNSNFSGCHGNEVVFHVLSFEVGVYINYTDIPLEKNLRTPGNII